MGFNNSVTCTNVFFLLFSGQWHWLCVNLKPVLISETNRTQHFSYATLTGLNPLKTQLDSSTLTPFCLPIPEVWQQSVEARVHRGFTWSIGGVGLQGKVQQEACDRGTPAPLLVVSPEHRKHWSVVVAPSAAEDPTGHGATDPVGDRQRH